MWCSPWRIATRSQRSAMVATIAKSRKERKHGEEVVIYIDDYTKSADKAAYMAAQLDDARKRLEAHE